MSFKLSPIHKTLDLEMNVVQRLLILPLLLISGALKAQSVVFNANPISINNFNKAAYRISGTCVGIQSGMPIILRSGATPLMTSYPITCSSGEWSVLYNFTAFPDGNLTLNAYLPHLTQKPVNTAPGVFNKDTSPPVLRFSVVQKRLTRFNQAAYSLNGICGGADGRVVLVRVVGTGMSNELIATPLCTSGRWTVTMNLTTLPDGPLTFKAASTDAAGNSAAAQAPRLLKGPLFVSDLKGNDSNSGSRSEPLKTLMAAHSRVGPGVEVRILEGVYRETLFVTTHGTLSEPISWVVEDKSRTYFTGADLIKEIRDEGGGNYSFDYPHTFGSSCVEKNSRGEPLLAHPCSIFYEVSGRAEQVIINDQRLEQVLSLSDLSPGKFYVAQTMSAGNIVHHKARIYLRARVGEDLPGLVRLGGLQASVRPYVVRVMANHNHFDGFHIKYAANLAQQGALALEYKSENGMVTFYEGNVVSNARVEKTSGDGASFSGRRVVVRDSVFSDNESVGISGGGLSDSLFTRNKVIGNNTHKYHSGWQAGGVKICWSKNLEFTENLFEKNIAGPGLWLDISVDNVKISQNVFNENEEVGIHYEISTRANITDNLIVRNGTNPSGGSWGIDGGISLSSSNHSVVRGNLFIDNRENIQFRDMGSSQEFDKGKPTHHFIVYRNRITELYEEPVIGQDPNWKSIKSNFEIWSHDNLIENNYFLSRVRPHGNGVRQFPHIVGWFSNLDARLWPTPKPSLVVAPAARVDWLNKFVSLSIAPGPLENLKIKFVGNRYSAHRQDYATEWGVTRNFGPQWYSEKYFNLNESQRNLGIFVGETTLSEEQILLEMQQRLSTMSPFLRSYAHLLTTMYY